MKKLLKTVSAFIVALSMTALPLTAEAQHNGGRQSHFSSSQSQRPAQRPSNGGGHNGGGQRPGNGGGDHNGGQRPGNGGGQRPGNGNGNHNGGQRPGNGNGNHNGGQRPGNGNGNHNGGYRPGGNDRPGNGNGNHNGGYRPGGNDRPGNGNHNGGYRPGGNDHRPGNGNHNGGYRPGGNDHRPGNGNHNGGYRPGGNNHRPDPGYRPGGYRPGRPGGYHRPPAPPRFHGHNYHHPVPFFGHYHRPVPPPRWRPVHYSPSFGTILGITLGTAINVSINSLINSGYTVSSYGDNVVYLSNVPQLNYYWPDAALYYNNGALCGSTFTYPSDYYDMTRYNAVYNTLCSQYGAPVNVVNTGGVMSSTWFGPSNRFVTLEFNSNYGNYYTSLSFGM